jgi:hypothetical protein
MINARSGHTATLMASGKVFIAGGSSSPIAKLYDPVNNTFSVAGGMTTVRFDHAATMLMNGTVLLNGGWDNSGSEVALASTELY